MTSRRKLGRLLLIGGAEERSADGVVLRRFVEMAGAKRARLIVCGAAVEDPLDTLREYEDVFRSLGAEDVALEPYSTREAGEAPQLLDATERATAVFFTGGDQLRITSLVAGTAFGERIRDRLQRHGLVVGGTSAGAAAASSVMLIGGRDDGTVRRADVQLAPGLGYWRDTVVDTHFNQRGRVHRLLTLFSSNPQVLGIGLDEDTAIEVVLGHRFTVHGSGAVMVFDGRVTHSNAAEIDDTQILALTDSVVHVLAHGYGFDLEATRPLLPDGTRIEHVAH